MVILNKIHFVAIISLFIGLIINILPVTEFLVSIKPPILLLILIYWALAFPNYINLTYAFITGLLMDILLIVPLGYYSLCFIITIYLTLIYYPQIRLQSNLNKMLSLLVILIPYFLVSTVINGALGMNYEIIDVCISILLAVIIWPGIFGVLRFIRKKYIS
jgi:rod shape-determining protein MreD